MDFNFDGVSIRSQLQSLSYNNNDEEGEEDNVNYEGELEEFDEDEEGDDLCRVEESLRMPMDSPSKVKVGEFHAGADLDAYFFSSAEPISNLQKKSTSNATSAPSSATSDTASTSNKPRKKKIASGPSFADEFEMTGFPDDNIFPDAHPSSRGYDDDGDNDAMENIETAPPEMPKEFYDHVDTFLKKPPPKIKVSNKKKNTADVISQEANSSAKVKSAGSSVAKKKISATTTRPSSISQLTGGKGSRHIDEDLLRQAFEYTDQLAKEAAADEEMEATEKLNAAAALEDRRTLAMMNRLARTGLNNNAPVVSMGQPRSAPTLTTGLPPSSSKKPNLTGNAVKKPGMPNKSLGGNSVVKRLRVQTGSAITFSSGDAASNREGSSSGQGRSSAASSAGGFDVSGVAVEEDLRRNALDFDALVANFEQGLTLTKLQKELQQSQSAMAASEQFMRKLAQDFSMMGGGAGGGGGLSKGSQRKK